MTFAFWCVFAASLLPLISAHISKVGAKDFDNAAPRDWIETQSGWRRRADWAQRNHLEALPVFVAAVTIAALAHAPQWSADLLAGMFVVLRIAYTAAYIFDRPTLRSALWSLGLACIVGLFIISV